MAVKRTQLHTNTSYFVTFTCYDWLPLIERTHLYDDIYRWFELLRQEENHILGYVIMPNHLHMLIKLSQHSKSINRLIAEGKRFRAYEIVKRLREQHQDDYLTKMSHGLTEAEISKGSKHRVFTNSFDCKECYSAEFIQQKLMYMHNNPVKAELVSRPSDYIHSSAKYYQTGEQGIYPVTNYLDYYDVPIAR